MSKVQGLMERTLQTLTETFARSPMVAARELRRLLDADYKAFLESALKVMKGKELQPAHQYMLTLLATRNLIVTRLADPAGLETAEAVEIARHLQSANDSSLATKLLACIVPARGAVAAVADKASLLRVLEIVGAIASDARVVPQLSQLLEHADVEVRSKVALALGRINKSPAWVQARLTEPDARVRANAVESVWGLGSAEARQIFETALRDPDNRVAGNGALGLYRCGDLNSAEELAGMLVRPEPLFRATAAWAMGATGDPRFLGQLASGTNDRDARVRQNVLRAMCRIRRRAKEIEDRGRLQVVITRSEIGAGTRRLSVAVLGPGGQSVRDLRPPAVVLVEGGAVVHQIEVQQGKEAEYAGAAFALPRMADLQDPFRQALAAALEVFPRYKRKLDSWSAIQYAPPAPPAAPVLEFRLASALLRSGSGTAREAAAGAAEAKAAAASHLEPVRFSTDARVLAQGFEPLAANAAVCPGACEAARRLIDALAGVRGARTLFVFSPRCGAGDWAEVRERARIARVAVYVIAMGYEVAEDVAAACRDTGGGAVTAAAPAELKAVCERAAATQAGPYSIEYPWPTPCSGAVKVQIYCDLGCGEDVWSTPQTADGRPAPGGESSAVA